jgi:hypothetical protein
VLRVFLTVPNRYGSALTPKANLPFCEMLDDNVFSDGVFNPLVHLFQACIIVLLWWFFLGDPA